ncbi:MAG: SDR family oxidoreductase, partial [Dehalococcoidia bacterium]|nr:SDR family oxidoreductase [Dehalococcoidia bacterium]
MGRQQVLIVGGAKGVGRATVQLLDADGRELIVLDRDQAALHQLGERVSRHVLDITDRAAVKRRFSQLQAEGASLRSVVICAGAHSTYPVEYIPDEVIDQVMEVNF